MTDDAPNIGLSEALRIIGDLVTRHAAKHGRAPEMVVALGGTAMAAHGVRERSWDIDLFLSDVDDDLVAEVWTQGVHDFGPKFKMDVTPVNTIWGPLSVRDIADSPAIGRISAGGTEIEVRALSLETLFLLKVIAGRTKDLDDLSLLSRHTTADRILARARETLPWYGERDRLPNYVEALGRHISRLYGTPVSSIEASLNLPRIVQQSLDDRRHRMDERTALLLKAALRNTADSIRADISDRAKLVFDPSPLSTKTLELATSRPDLTQKILEELWKQRSPEQHSNWRRNQQEQGLNPEQTQRRQRSQHARWADDYARWQAMDLKELAQEVDDIRPKRKPEEIAGRSPQVQTPLETSNAAYQEAREAERDADWSGHKAEQAGQEIALQRSKMSGVSRWLHDRGLLKSKTLDSKSRELISMTDRAAQDIAKAKEHRAVAFRMGKLAEQNRAAVSASLDSEYHLAQERYQLAKEVLHERSLKDGLRSPRIEQTSSTDRGPEKDGPNPGRGRGRGRAAGA